MISSGSFRLRSPLVASLAVCVITALAIVVGASAGNTKNGNNTVAQADPGLAAAKKNLLAHIAPPAKIGPTAPIGKPIPTGKTILHSNCGVEGCVYMGDGLKEAAKVLGWKVETINVVPTPQGIQAYFDEAIRRKPDGVVSVGFPAAVYQRQLAKLKSMGIPVVSANALDKPVGGIVVQIEGIKWSAQATALVADKTIVDSGGKGVIGVALLTEYPIVAAYTKAYTDEIAKNCPKCKTKTIELAPTDIGKDAAQKIANFLRANPDIKYLFLSYDPLGSGLKTAARNAGASMPLVYSWSQGKEGLAALRTGALKAGVPQDYYMQGWMFADAFARVFTGQNPAAQGSTWPGFVLWSKDYKNIPAAPKGQVVPDITPGYRDQFKKLWGMSK